MVAAGELPAPLKRKRKWARWPATDVHAYLDNLLSQGRGQQPVHASRFGTTFSAEGLLEQRHGLAGVLGQGSDHPVGPRSVEAHQVGPPITEPLPAETPRRPLPLREDAPRVPEEDRGIDAPRGQRLAVR